MAWFLVNSDDLKRIGGGGVDPGFGVQGPRPPVDPGYGVPAPPLVPGYPLPGGPSVTPPIYYPPVDPGYGHPSLPGGGWSPGLRPDQGLPPSPGHPWMPGWLAGILGGPRPDHSLPGSGAHPWLPGHIPGLEPPPTKPIDPDAPLTGYILVWVPGEGYKVIAIPIEKPAEPK